MIFDQPEENYIALKDLEDLKKEIENLRHNAEKLGEGVSVLIEALYKDDGSLRDFSDSKTRIILSETADIIKNIPKEIRLNASDSNLIKELITIKNEGIKCHFKEEDRAYITELKEDLKKIRTYFWWVFYAVSVIFILLGIWILTYSHSFRDGSMSNEVLRCFHYLIREILLVA